MKSLILHQYDASPFSEKIRALLGYKKMAYDKVDIPVIMPKPMLMPLTGGYRKTPVLQIGADIFCDTALMCRVIDRMDYTHSIYPKHLASTINIQAHWFDSNFFRIAVAKVFQPRVLANHPLFADAKAAEAFVADRAKLSEGALAPLDPAEAEASWTQILKQMDQQLASRIFLFGDTPCIVDFSAYHCIWFVYQNEILQAEVEQYANVYAWYKEMSNFSEFEANAMAAEAALNIAAQSAPLGSQFTDEQGALSTNISTSSSASTDTPEIGSRVSVSASDYGREPSEGELVALSSSVISIKRSEKDLGELMVHFPRMGFKVEAV